jgi:dodecin
VGGPVPDMVLVVDSAAVRAHRRAAADKSSSPWDDLRCRGCRDWLLIRIVVDTGGHPMAESVYKVIELVGTSPESWEKAAKAAVERAAETLRDLRVAEVVEQDMQLQNGKVELYRAKVKVSFKYEKESD